MSRCKCREGHCEFVIKDNIEFCIHCGRVKEIMPPMCEIIGECEWIIIDNVELCSQCGRLKPNTEGGIPNSKEGG